MPGTTRKYTCPSAGNSLIHLLKNNYEICNPCNSCRNGTRPFSTGAIIPPIYQTSTFVQAAPGNHKGYEYARSQNPTRKALETALASIENARFALSFSSGVAASDAVIRLLLPGDEVIAANDMYGGTFRLFSKIFEKTGIHFHYVNMQNPENIRGLDQ